MTSLRSAETGSPQIHRAAASRGGDAGDAGQTDHAVLPVRKPAEAHEKRTETAPARQLQQRGAPSRQRSRHSGTQVGERDGEKRQQRPPARHDRQDQRHRFAPLFQPPAQGQRESGPHREEEKREDQIDPRNSRHRRVEAERRRRHLRMKQPRRKFGVPQDLPRQHHSHDSQSPQQIDRISSFFHLHVTCYFRYFCFLR